MQNPFLKCAKIIRSAPVFLHSDMYMEYGYKTLPVFPASPYREKPFFSSGSEVFFTSGSLGTAYFSSESRNLIVSRTLFM